MEDCFLHWRFFNLKWIFKTFKTVDKYTMDSMERRTAIFFIKNKYLCFRRLWLVLLLLFPFTLHAQILPLHPVQYIHEDFSLPGRPVHHLFQDQEGFIWMHVDQIGLVRYDGREFRVNGFGKEVRAPIFMQDHAGHLWIGTEKGLFVSALPLKADMDVEQLKIVNEAPNYSLPKEDIRDLAVDKLGQVWVATDLLLLRYQWPAGSHLKVDTLLKDREGGYLELFVPNDESLWITHRGEMVPLSLKISITSDSLKILEQWKSPMQELGWNDQQGKWWGYFGEDDLVVVDTNGRQKSIALNKGLWHSSQMMVLNDSTLLDFANIRYWGEAQHDSRITEISTTEVNVKRQWDAGSGLPANVTDLIVDQNRYIWLAHEQGVSFLPANYQAFQTFGVNGQSIDKEVVDLLQFSAEESASLFPHSEDAPSIAIATTNEVFIQTKSGTTLQFKVTDDWHPIVRLFRDPQGNLIIGASDGIYQLELPRFLEKMKEYQLENPDMGSINQMLQSYCSEIPYDQYDLVPPKFFEEEPPAPFIPDNDHISEVLKWEGHRFDAFSCYVQMGDECWVGVEKGILVLDNKSWKSKRLIPLKVKPTAMLAQNGKLWFCSEKKGLWEIDPVSYQLKRQIFLPPSGTNRTLPNWGKQLYSGPNGSIYIGSVEGLYRYEPGKDVSEKQPVPVYVTNSSFQEDLWGRNELNLQFVALSFKNVFSLRYKTRLKGFDADWSEETSDPTIRYTNLPAFFSGKTYSFEVMAKDYRGQWYKMGTPFTVRVRPPIYFRWWAFFLYAALASLGIRTYVRFRLREQAQRQKLQEAEIIKEQRDQIAKKNAQNELLLKEIHHRVKNNLEVVSSLLDLQSEQVEDPLARSVMLASQSRVQSMGIIHRKLYQGENLADIEMKDYFLHLKDNLLETYQVADQIRIECDMAPLELDIDTAIPIGLIVNELLTNAIKYAFPEGKKGVIRVGMKKTQEGHLSLIVEDNGIGKGTVAPGKRGFGSKLVQLLTRQLNGQMEEKEEEGLQYYFLFQLKSP